MSMIDQDRVRFSGSGSAVSGSTAYGFYDNDKIFVKDGYESVDGLFKGKWLSTDNKFTTEFTPNGFCKINFGNGKGNLNDFSSLLSDLIPFLWLTSV